MKGGPLLAAALLAACVGAEGGPSQPRLELELTAGDTLKLEIPVSLRPCVGDSAFLLQGVSEEGKGHGVMALLRTDSLKAGDYPLGVAHQLAVRYNRSGLAAMMRADSGALTITGTAPRGFRLTVSGTVIEVDGAVRHRMSGGVSRLRPDTAHVRCGGPDSQVGGPSGD